MLFIFLAVGLFPETGKNPYPKKRTILIMKFV